MKLVRHEQELAARFQDQPFEIVGVNCDSEVDRARDAVARTGTTWRSFRNQAGDALAITSDWKVLGYLTVYHIDHHGIIRKRWIGIPPPAELAQMTGILVDSARRNLSPGAMPAVPAALSRSMVSKPAPAGESAVVTPRPGTGFLDKVYGEALPGADRP
jgi:hypothetical protein